MVETSGAERTESELTTAVDQLVDVMLQLGRLKDLLGGDEPLEGVLRRLAEAAQSSIPDAEAVSVTLVSAEGTRTIATTRESVVAIDDLQYAGDEGPCLEAARQRRPVRVNVEEARERWPEFATVAADAGMRSYLSAPLILDEEEPVLGALNLYGTSAEGFDPIDEALLRMFTAAASAAITNARRYAEAAGLVEQLREALTSRAEIDQAKGILMALHGVDADQAFDLLVRRSQDTNIKIREVARKLLVHARTKAQDLG